MSDLISREALIKEVLESREAFRCGHTKTDMHDLMCDNVISWVEGAETVDAVPVVHGYWIDKQEDDATDGMWRCSACGSDRYFDIMTPLECGCYYCPNCGAKMDGGDKG